MYEPDNLPQIARYQHLTQAYQQACQQAKLNLNQLVHNKQVLLKLYTCYPVVPMAFLISSGLIDSLNDMPQFLNEHLLTINGGMNLALSVFAATVTADNLHAGVSF